MAKERKRAGQLDFPPFVAAELKVAFAYVAQHPSRGARTSARQLGPRRSWTFYGRQLRDKPRHKEPANTATTAKHDAAHVSMTSAVVFRAAASAASDSSIEFRPLMPRKLRSGFARRPQRRENKNGAFTNRIKPPNVAQQEPTLFRRGALDSKRQSSSSKPTSHRAGLMESALKVIIHYKRVLIGWKPLEGSERHLGIMR